MLISNKIIEVRKNIIGIEQKNVEKDQIEILEIKKCKKYKIH